MGDRPAGWFLGIRPKDVGVAPPRYPTQGLFPLIRPATGCGDPRRQRAPFAAAPPGANRRRQDLLSVAVGTFPSIG